MSHDGLRSKLSERNSFDVAQNFHGLLEAGLLAAAQIDLRDIAGDDGGGTETDTREEHLHLLGGGVLRLVENDERIVERAAAHVRERSYLDAVAFEQPL